MRIGIDARWIFAEASGIGVYTAELIRSLAAIDHENEYTVFFNSTSIRDRVMRNIGANFSAQIAKWGLFSPASQLFMPGMIRKNRLDVFHSPNYMIPFLAFPRNACGRTACVVTVHDVIPMLFPDHAPKSRKSRMFALYRRLMLEVGKRADIIIADSNASRRDVILKLAIPENRHSNVRTVYCGVSGDFRPLPSKHAAKRTSDTRTVLYVGRCDPYKNCVALIEAFSILKKQCRLPVKLRMAGNVDPRYPEINRRISELGLKDSVERGYVASDRLVSEYQNADVFVLPSCYEGFGLPVLEAMACGIPVICSNKGSLPEIAEKVAIMLEPDDKQALAVAMQRVLEDPELAEEFSQTGLRHAAKFTWQKTAGETLAAYRDAALRCLSR